MDKTGNKNKMGDGKPDPSNFAHPSDYAAALAEWETLYGTSDNKGEPRGILSEERRLPDVDQRRLPDVDLKRGSTSSNSPTWMLH